MLREHNAPRLGLDFRLAKELLGGDPRWQVTRGVLGWSYARCSGGGSLWWGGGETRVGGAKTTHGGRYMLPMLLYEGG